MRWKPPEMMPTLQAGVATIPTSPQNAGSRSKTMLWVGRSLSGLTVLFMLFDGLSKLAMEHHVVEATTTIGYSVAVIRPLGLVLIACTILYVIPRTAIFGAILLTGYLGGAVASKVRIDDPIFSSILFGVYFGLLAWGGLYLRDERLRALIPFRR
jgi:DoxX-like family